MKPQTASVYKHLCRHGKLTALEALNKLGTLRLAARVQELRDDGINVRTVLIQRNGKRFAEYRLA